MSVQCGDFYETVHPRPTDCFLLVEVGDSTIDYDREVKIPLYAENGIIEVWLIDLNGEAIEVYRQPGVNGYQYRSRFVRGQALSLGAFANIASSQPGNNSGIVNVSSLVKTIGSPEARYTVTVEFLGATKIPTWLPNSMNRVFRLEV